MDWVTGTFALWQSAGTVTQMPGLYLFSFEQSPGPLICVLKFNLTNPQMCFRVLFSSSPLRAFPPCQCPMEVQMLE